MGGGGALLTYCARQNDRMKRLFSCDQKKVFGALALHRQFVLCEDALFLTGLCFCEVKETATTEAHFLECTTRLYFTQSQRLLAKKATTAVLADSDHFGAIFPFVQTSESDRKQSNAMRAGRPRVRGNGRRQKKATASDKDGGAGAESKTRTSVNYRHKLNVIEYYLAHDRDASATVEHFYPTATKELRRRKMQLVSSWQKQHAKIRQHCESGMAHQRNVRHPGQGATLPREVEEQIVEWMYAQRRDGVKVTAKMLQQTARELAGECGFEEGVFTASWSWRDAFMKRHFRSPHAAPARQLSSPPDQPAAPQETESGTDDDAEPEPDVVEDGGDGEDADDAGDEPEKESDRAQVGDQEMPTSDTLATLLRENGLEQYLEVLRENGFETPASVRRERSAGSRSPHHTICCAAPSWCLFVCLCRIARRH